MPLHPRDDTFPGEVFLRLAADALDWCAASRAAALEGLRERFLPEHAFRGRQSANAEGGREHSLRERNSRPLRDRIPGHIGRFSIPSRADVRLR